MTMTDEALLAALTTRLHEGFPEGPEHDEAERASWEAPLMALADRLHDNFPYASPLYAGQMLKPPHPVARLAYALTLRVNPNNHATDGGRASTELEKEGIAQLAQLFGLDPYVGHLTGGGTLANLEALWVSGQLKPGGVILASEHAHYTHQRISAVLGLGFEAIPADRQGRMRVDRLEARLKQGNVAAVVATMGSTGMGSVDPLQDILPLARDWGVRVHADAAYGGYFKLTQGALAEAPAAAFSAISEVDSVVVDPHKHGLQPYGCGAVLFRDPSVGRFYKHDSPYTYFTSGELQLGEISLECSRPGAAAAALWATLQRFPLVEGGDFAAGLGRCLQAARELYRRLDESDDWRVLSDPDLDIVVWAPKAALASETDALSQAVFDQAAQDDLHLALYRLPKTQLAPLWPDLKWDVPEVRCLRSTLMKWEHLEHLDEIWARLQRAAAARA